MIIKNKASRFIGSSDNVPSLTPKKCIAFLSRLPFLIQTIESSHYGGKFY